MTITCRLQPQEKKYRSMPDCFRAPYFSETQHVTFATIMVETLLKIKIKFGTTTEAVIVKSTLNFVGTQIT